MPAEQRRTPAVTLHWALFAQSLARSGDLPLHCCRCGMRLVVDLPAMAFGEPAGTVGSACPGCNTGFSVTLCGPAAVRPPITPGPIGAWATAAPADPTPPPLADETQLRTLAEWRQLGVGTELHPSEAAAVPRRADEAPHRRNPEGNRLYTRTEIEQAIALHHGGQADG